MKEILNKGQDSNLYIHLTKNIEKKISVDWKILIAGIAPLSAF